MTKDMRDDFKNIIEVLEGPGGWNIAAIKIKGLILDYDALLAKANKLAEALEYYKRMGENCETGELVVDEGKTAQQALKAWHADK